MKLLFLTQYFPPETGAPQSRIHELAKHLQHMGYEITVLTALPNYPTGKIFSGYRGKIRVSENIDGFKIIRTFILPSKSSKLLPRLISYISFSISCLLLGTIGIGKHDIVMIESPPLFLVPSGILLSKLVHGKAVIMVSDIWPDILVRMGSISKGISLKMMLWLEKFSYMHSYAVALTNLGANQQIKERFPCLKNITIISNGVDTKVFSPECRNDNIRMELGAGPNDFLVGYCGLFGLAQGLDVIIDAAEILFNHKHIKFVLVGDGPTRNELLSIANRKSLFNLNFFERRPKKEIPVILASLDVSLVPLKVHLPGTMPSKVYEALASGTPPIVAKGCEAHPLVMEFEVGRSYEPGDADEMASAILELAVNQDLWHHLKRNCINLSKRFDRSVIAKRTAKTLSAITKGEPIPENDW